ncbi:adenylate kinase [Sorangium sp. So ce388]|uniref:flagellin N-terminal helical domain-containing protein n=1 Tax=Sorangium sp. So ce388 TaxID=3133309 RepID=UPI003F5BDFD8
MSDDNTTAAKGTGEVGLYEARPSEVVRDARSAADAITLTQVTEGALVEVVSLLQRIRVLSIQSANGTYSEEDRSAIQIEVDQLMDEIGRVAGQVEATSSRMLTTAEPRIAAADELGMTPAKINTPPSLANAQSSWTLRVHVGANTNEALAVNIFATNIRYLLAAGAPVKITPRTSGGAAVAGPVNVMTAIDANSSITKIDFALKAIADQRSNLNAFRTRLEGEP